MRHDVYEVYTMLSIERKLFDWCEKNKLILFSLAVSLLAILIRIVNLDALSEDYIICLQPWFDEIAAKGGLSAISEQVGDYNVMYQLIIALMTYIPLPTVVLYKGLSILFDYLLALCAACVAYEISGERIKAVLAYAAVLLLPSVYIDSSYWAQCDSIYSFFLLTTLYCLLKEKHFLAFVFYTLAFQFKFQSIFVLPFLLCYYAGTKKFSILNLCILPVFSIVFCWLCGRDPLYTFKIYFEQTKSWPGLAHNFPSIWNLVTNDYTNFRNTAIFLTIAILGIELLLILHHKIEFNHQNMLSILILTMWTCMVFLPSLHDRYAYFLLILLLLATVLSFRMLVYLAGSEILILISYSRFLFKDSIAAQIPQYLCSAAFVALYIAFIYDCFIRKTQWLSSKSPIVSK